MKATRDLGTVARVARSGIASETSRCFPGVRGAVVLSRRGGDFLFDSGQDLALGYDRHDDEAVHPCLVESFSFRVATSEAAATLAPG